MSRSMGDILSRRKSENFVDRKLELDQLLGYVMSAEPAVVHVHGIPGIGKTSLLDMLTHRVAKTGFSIISLECREIEPSSRAFLSKIGEVTKFTVTSVREAAVALDRLGERVILSLDTYEMFRMLDTWLRVEFLPGLKDNVRIFLFGREPPVPAWLIAPEWQGLFHNLHLGPLTDSAAAEMLLGTGIPDVAIPRVIRFSHGNPLALRLMAGAILERPELDLEKIASQTVVAELTRTYISDIQDPATRSGLEAASVVRRMTQSLLSSMLSKADSRGTIEKLQTLLFVETDPDGLLIHDAVQEAIATFLRSSDPMRYRDLRRKAWRYYRNEVHLMTKSEIWQHSADMLYLVEQPLIRDAFFPSNLQPYAIEQAKPRDSEAIISIIETHEGEQAAEILIEWWRQVPQYFFSVRDGHGSVVGFYILFDPEEVDIGLMRSDPITWRLLRQLREDPVPPKQKAVFCRRWLDAKTGERLSPVISACFLDIKGYYVAMKQSLRRLYCTRVDNEAFAPLFKELRFRSLEDCSVELNGQTYHTDMLDFGPALFNGWITRLVGKELGIDEEDILDADAAELVLDGNRIALTPLELGVMQYLEQHEGDIVRRSSLLENVWGYGSYTGSNVVDTKIRSLRKKLGEYAQVIETVSGMGYRFRRI
jgi:hypothetical protein